MSDTMQSAANQREILALHASWQKTHFSKSPKIQGYARLAASRVSFMIRLYLNDVMLTAPWLYFIME
jgi:hypothetical protein